MNKQPQAVHLTGYHPEGSASANVDNKNYHVWNALQGETVEIDSFRKKKKGHRIAVAGQILTPHPSRISAIEDHFLCCSPWQIMTPEQERTLKISQCQTLFREAGVPEAMVESIDLYEDSKTLYGYRNKMEYSFWAEKDPRSLNLAFFERGTSRKRAIEACLLADPKINETAVKVLKHLEAKANDLLSYKSLIVRSDQQGHTLGALFIKNQDAFDLPMDLIPKHLIGFSAHYSDPRSPASVSHGLLFSYGRDFLCSRLKNLDFHYGLFSFFQVNVPIFENALEDISNALEGTEKLIDLFCGVGAIGLSLASKASKVILADAHPESIAFATKNIQINDIANARAMCGACEDIPDILENDVCVILDPPRSGLHPNLLEKILSVQPKRLAYLSCNPITQAADLKILLSCYQVTRMRLYNFFPRTPHTESLIILDRIKT